MPRLPARIAAALDRLIAAAGDPARAGRTVAWLAVAYAAAWALYGAIALSSQDLNADMAEMIVWAREPAWGFPKHPPFLAWVLTAWFAVFPLQHWAYLLLAACTCALGLWLAHRLAREWLTGDKLALVPILLALVPFYNFLGLKFDQNSALIPLWALATLGFVRSLDTRKLGWAVLTGVALGAAMLTKYWSAFLAISFAITALLDHRRAAYFRSPAPYVSAAIAAAAFAPHVAWLIHNDFPPFKWVANRRVADSVGDWFRSLGEYSLGTAGYAVVALITWAVAAHPSLAALCDIVWPRDPDRRRLALLFWLPLAVPILVAIPMKTALLSLWNTGSLNLLPVLLLASPLIAVPRAAAIRAAALAAAVTLAPLVASPVIAYLMLTSERENEGAYAHLVGDELTRQWRAATDQPLRLMAGPFGLISTAAWDAADRPSTFADFSPYLAPWATPERVAAQGLAIACPNSDGWQWCIKELTAHAAAVPGSRVSEVELRRHWLGFAGPPARFTLAILPPRG